MCINFHGAQIFMPSTGSGHPQKLSHSQLCGLCQANINPQNVSPYQTTKFKSLKFTTLMNSLCSIAIGIINPAHIQNDRLSSARLSVFQSLIIATHLHCHVHILL